MSHFSCLIVGNDPEKQLEPFSEHIEVPEYNKGVVSDEDVESFIEHYKKNRPDEINPSWGVKEIYHFLGMIGTVIHGNLIL